MSNSLLDALGFHLLSFLYKRCMSPNNSDLLALPVRNVSLLYLGIHLRTHFFSCKTQILLWALKRKLFLELFYVFREYRSIHKVMLVSVSYCARKWRGVQVNCFQRSHVFWTCSPHCICLFSSFFAVSSQFFLPSWKQFPTDVHCHAMNPVKEKLYCLLLPHCGKQEVWQMMFPDRKLMQGIGISVISKKNHQAMQFNMKLLWCDWLQLLFIAWSHICIVI